ncbi:heavy-metal-associated domain-containing protein [Pseudoduganella danionis]|uniref:heavy-metal-associated domain-containing protein n=1 Tax=Pseudoduganella danionis TaxID=1890295 RepID=UPI0035AE947A
MQNTVINIEKMEDEGSADTITQILLKLSGVEEVRVSLRDCLASVQFDESRTSPLRMTASLEAAGYPSYVSAGAATPQAAARAGGCCGGCCGG